MEGQSFSEERPFFACDKVCRERREINSTYSEYNSTHAAKIRPSQYHAYKSPCSKQ